MGFFSGLSSFLGSPGGSLALGIGGSVLGGVLGSNAASDAAGAQVAASNAAIAEQRRQFDLARSDLAPFREQGVNALNQFAAENLGPLEATPQFNFLLDQGVAARDRSAAARGKLLSGQQVKAIEGFGQDLARQTSDARLNRLASLAGIGQTATNTGVQAGAGAASNIGNAFINAGDARASGFVGSSNAINDSINNFLLFNALRP
jgi:hypothetical protein